MTQLKGFMNCNTPAIAEKMFGEYKAKLGRYQITNWNAGAMNQEQYIAWFRAQYKKIVEVLKEADYYNAQVAIDLHTPPGGVVDGSLEVLTPGWERDTLIFLWAELVSELKDYGIFSDCIYGYDLLNEPPVKAPKRNIEKLLTLYKELGRAIRPIDKTTPIIIESPLGEPDFYSLMRAMPELDPVIYSFHFYYPGEISYQGVDMPNNPVNSNVLYPSARFDKQWLVNRLKAVDEFILNNTVGRKKPKFYVGEFSCSKSSGYPYNNRLNLIKDMIRIFAHRKWDWTYHAMDEACCWNPEMGRIPGPGGVSTNCVSTRDEEFIAFLKEKLI